MTIPTPSPTKKSTGFPLHDARRVLKAHGSRSEVSDSEEERRRRIGLKRHAALADVSQNELRIIVIESSDEEDTSPSASIVAQKGTQPTEETPSEGDAPRPSSPLRDESDDEDLPPVTPRRRPGQVSRTRQLVLSSESEDDSDDEPPQTRDPAPCTPSSRRRVVSDPDDIIDLTLTSPESDKPPSRATNPPKPRPRSRAQDKSDSGVAMIPLFVDEEEGGEEDQAPLEGTSYDDDGAILVLDEPPSAQKPIRMVNAAPGPSTPRRRGPAKPKAPPAHSSDSEHEVASLIAPGAGTPVTATPRAGKTPGKGPRMTKAALARLEQQRRREYAATLFRELNDTVFGGGLPAGTELQWNKRLLTTAGRARWRRTRDGVHETSIQLAEKILDCDERIRNTLSHEMCHLACWIIDGAPNEHHGSLFKSWARKVMRKRPEIEVTTRHSYEIKCKYEWKCSNCGKVYGRHSKSIDPDAHICGVCKVGRLVPQFESRRAPKTPKSNAGSQNAAARGLDSPMQMPGGFPSPSPGSSATIPQTPLNMFSEHNDSDVEILAHKLQTIRLAGSGIDA